MRICYVSHSNSHFTAPYVEYFSRCGYDVHLISCAPQDLPGAVNHHPVGGDFDPRKANLSYFWIQRKVRRLIHQIKPDLVHAHYVTSNGLMAAMSGFHPLIVSARGSDVIQAMKHPLKRRLIQYVMNRADLVNAVSRELEERIISLGIPAERIVRLCQGIDADRFNCDRSSRRPGPIRLICTRQLRPIYQPRRIVRALIQLAREGVDFEFSFGADGSETAELKQMVRDAGLDAQVRFLLGYDNAHLPAMLADADVYVSASLWDGTSPALLEAMASGTFPVVSDITSNREWLTGKGDSLLFDPDRDDVLLECLRTAICDEGLRRDAVLTVRRRVLADGDRQTNMAKLAEHYELLAGARPVAHAV